MVSNLLFRDFCSDLVIFRIGGWRFVCSVFCLFVLICLSCCFELSLLLLVYCPEFVDWSSLLDNGQLSLGWCSNCLLLSSSLLSKIFGFFMNHNICLLGSRSGAHWRNMLCKVNLWLLYFLLFLPILLFFGLFLFLLQFLNSDDFLFVIYFLLFSF